MFLAYFWSAFCYAGVYDEAIKNAARAAYESSPKLKEKAKEIEEKVVPEWSKDYSTAALIVIRFVNEQKIIFVWEF